MKPSSQLEISLPDGSNFMCVCVCVCVCVEREREST